ncbi:MAG: helicase HerA-like domain-containing protein [Bacteroidota bacterium]
MATKEEFISAINQGYACKGDFITLGGAVFNGACCSEAHVTAPLKTFNRHGLIAGATGSGKTKTLQGIAERLSEKGIPVLLMDIKGDLSGIAKAGTSNEKLVDRHTKIGIPWTQMSFPAELLSLSKEKGARLRATVTEFGPVLFSKILDLNDTQGGVVSLVFKYADDNSLLLLDLKDFKKVLQYLINEGKEEIKKEYGAISTASASTILRKIVEIEQQGADEFFGEKSFDVNDLIRISDEGKGIINIVRLTDIQDKPKLFSTFMLCLLAEIYATFPEEGDTDQPKLVLFIDEAHLVFKEASDALLEQLESIIKLIRSKGVGVFFCTQLATDIPANVLSQLGMKIQHAYRAFTANDRKSIKTIADNYPMSDFYKTEDLMTELGIGEALITVLSEKGTPTPLAHTLLCAPRSAMDILTPSEMDALISKSSLVKKYNEVIDRESAYEMLNKKLSVEDAEPPAKGKEEPSVATTIINSTVGRQVARTVAREVTRGLLGILGLKGTTSRKSKSWF